LTGGERYRIAKCGHGVRCYASKSAPHFARLKLPRRANLGIWAAGDLVSFSNPPRILLEGSIINRRDRNLNRRREFRDSAGDPRIDEVESEKSISFCKSDEDRLAIDQEIASALCPFHLVRSSSPPLLSPPDALVLILFRLGMKYIASIFNNETRSVDLSLSLSLSASLRRDEHAG